jgi:tetratricopeptide (TPR) repeat protein
MSDAAVGGVPGIEELRDMHAAIEQRLAHVTDAASKAQLKADIIVLYRHADQGLKAYTALLEATRQLIDAWKALEQPAVPEEIPQPVAAVRGTPRRVDHLGASTYIEKGWSRISIEEPQQAEEALRHALELAPASSDAETLLAWSLAMQGRNDEAHELLGVVLARDPRHAQALVTSGLVALQRGELEEATALLKRAVAHAEYDRRALLYAHLYLGRVYLARDRHEDAAQYLRKALELGPNLVEAEYELGRTLWFAGARSEAMSTWRDAGRSNKFSPWGKRCRELLEGVERGEEPSRAH